jgi:ubiquitin-protein ligase
MTETDDLIIEESDNIYNISICNNFDFKLYEFKVPKDYPFRPPKLKINYKFYSDYQKLGSVHFTNALYKYKGISCFCCESILCYNNWGPQLTFMSIFDEVTKFRGFCREIAYRVIIDVIKRKYLMVDINIVEWLY